MRRTARMRKLIRRHQGGDTIIEVLIAIAVASAVLGITYGIMNKNLAIMRDNQERTEATKLAQAEIEQLKARLEVNRTEILSREGNPFCINADTGNIEALVATPPADFNAETYAAYTNCRRNFFGYYIQRDAGDTTNASYTVTIRWPAFSGGRSQLIMMYRIPR